MGVEALRAGDKRRARRLLSQVVNENPDNVAAWWFLSAAMETAEQRIECLHHVLRLRPDHAEARALLRQLERRVAHVTPPEGVERPVLDVRENTRGDLVPVPEGEWLPEADEPEPGSSAGDSTVLAVATAVALLAIVVTVILTWTGSAGVFGIQGPELEPTERVLSFDVRACARSSDGQTRLVFVNNTGVTLDVMEGAEGRERRVLTLGPDAQGAVDALAGSPVRYSIETRAQGMTGSGGLIEVPAGNECRVPIQ
jgi:hypothetical protein